MNHNESSSQTRGRLVEPRDPYRLPILGMTLLFMLVLPALITVIVTTEPAPTPPTWARWETVADRLGVDPISIESGQATFKATCAVCHGPEGKGIPRLGKPLRNNPFIQDHTNDELAQFIEVGRAPTDPENTTGAAMPPRAGQPLLKERRIRNVVAFLRTMQDPDEPLADMSQWIVERPTSAGDGDGKTMLSGVGHDAFIASCSACHGASGEGIEGLGKPLADSPFVEAKTDKELINFIKQGRPIWDPANTTGLDMPPKGGNPALSDEQLQQIVDYLRALHDVGEAS